MTKIESMAYWLRNGKGQRVEREREAIAHLQRSRPKPSLPRLERALKKGKE